MSRYDGWEAPRPGWVCRECGFEYDAQSPKGVPTVLEPLVLAYRSHLRRDANQLRERPDPSTWSALEYSCHVRDCLDLYDWRIRRVLTEQRPRLPAMRRDDVVVERAYNEQNPAIVAREMAGNSARLGELLSQIDGSEWKRVGVRQGEELSVAWMAVNTLHEAEHHLLDVRRILGG